MSNIGKRTFRDDIDEVTYTFHSDASQEKIDSLAFAGYWHDVKRLLIEFGYKVIEHPVTN